VTLLRSLALLFIYQRYRKAYQQCKNYNAQSDYFVAYKVKLCYRRKLLFFEFHQIYIVLVNATKEIAELTKI